MVFLLYQFITTGFQLYTMLLIIAILSSWFPQFHHLRIIQFVHWATEPYLRLFRKIIPPIGMLDLSPLVAFFALGILRSIILRVLFM